MAGKIEIVRSDVVVATIDERDGETVVQFPGIPSLDGTGMPFTISYAPRVTRAFAEAQIDAVLAGDIPPFAGL